MNVAQTKGSRIKMLLIANFKYCTLFVSETELRTDIQTDDPITRCLRRTFQARGIKITNVKDEGSVITVALTREYCCTTMKTLETIAKTKWSDSEVMSYFLLDRIPTILPTKFLN